MTEEHGRGRSKHKAEHDAGGGPAPPGHGGGKGVVFQQGALFPWLTAAANVAFAAKSRGVPPAERDALCSELLALVGLAGAESKYPFELSGGMQQRVAIARALAGSPRLLLADEPTGNLDSLMARGVMELLEEINRQGTTIVMVTHDPELAARAQRNVHVIDGQVTDFDEEPGLNRGRAIGDPGLEREAVSA